MEIVRSDQSECWSYSYPFDRRICREETQRKALLLHKRSHLNTYYANGYDIKNFGNLKAVDEAYHERDISDKIILKQKKVENLKAHFKAINIEIEETANALLSRINKL